MYFISPAFILLASFVLIIQVSLQYNNTGWASVRIVKNIYNIYRVSQEKCARLRESVPYVKVYRYNPKYLYPKLNGYGDNGQKKVRASCGSKYCNLHS
jgi:hypothetical protein